AAIGALVALGDAAAVCAPAVVGALSDRDPAVREGARDVLVALGPAAESALMDGLRVPPHIGARTVVPVLVSMGDKGTPVALAALDHISPFVRLNGLQALLELHDAG